MWSECNCRNGSSNVGGMTLIEGNLEYFKGNSGNIKSSGGRSFGKEILHRVRWCNNLYSSIILRVTFIRRVTISLEEIGKQQYIYLS